MKMNNDVSIVICCAGMGTRLGISTPKALVSIDGKPLIVKLLDCLKEYDDIRVVVGYESETIMKVINESRKDIMYVINREYQTTGPADSLSKALLGARKYVVVLDGDTLIKEEDLHQLINYDGMCMTHSEINSDEATYVHVIQNNVVSFNDGNKEFEWLGAAKLETEKLIKRRDYVYEMIKPLLPLTSIKIEGRGIDTQDDYEAAVAWINEYVEKEESIDE